MRTDLRRIFQRANNQDLSESQLMKGFFKLGYTDRQVAGAIGSSVRDGVIEVTGRIFIPSLHKSVNVFGLC